MFKNEVLISEKDKESALKYIRKVNSILNKYESESCEGCYTVTAMSRAKDHAGDAEEWIGYLYTRDDGMD